jgi:hypothetical protein
MQGRYRKISGFGVQAPLLWRHVAQLELCVLFCVPDGEEATRIEMFLSTLNTFDGV